jgi:hypothetical protein
MLSVEDEWGRDCVCCVAEDRVKILKGRGEGLGFFGEEKEEAPIIFHIQDEGLARFREFWDEIFRNFQDSKSVTLFRSIFPL